MINTQSLAFGNLIFAAILAVPTLGFALAIIFNTMWWLILLFPLMTLMEGGIFLITLAIVIASAIIG